MERSDFTDFSSLHEKLSTFLSKFCSRRKRPAFTLEAIKTSRGLAFLFVSIVLAWISVEATENQATEKYRNTHWPKLTVWTQTLTGRGLSPQKNLGEFTALLKTHPAPFSQDEKIWVSRDACVVYLPKSPFHPNPELWTCEKSPTAFTWTNLGSGLAGFEKMTDFFDHTPLKAKPAPVARAYKIDPKEFHY
jgi:hypothetical protein